VLLRTYDSEEDCQGNAASFIYEATVPLGPACTPGKDDLDNDIVYTVLSPGEDNSKCSQVSELKSTLFGAGLSHSTPLCR